VKGSSRTYAYPNPFSPSFNEATKSDGFVRFQYNTSREDASVTVKIYDFNMSLVRNLVTDRIRPSTGDYSEVWDGKNDLNMKVANGVYFYKIEFKGHDDAEILWGKVMVVD
jgi:flagellar hook assembly protein FlgD